MADPFSAKDTAHRLEVLAQDISKPSSYDASRGCSTAETNLVQELKALQDNPEHLKAVKIQILWDDLKPDGLPAVELWNGNGKVTLNIELSRDNQINIESSGKVYASNFPANNESAMQLSDRISLHINPAKMQGMFTNKVRAYSTPDQLNVER
jgi:hypothetical protein